jgi:hybrid cluster-associated redox disulfide protein
MLEAPAAAAPFFYFSALDAPREVHVITKEMTITEILTRYPETLPVFERYGLDCYNCQIAEFEQLEHGATVHKVDINALIDELNRHTRT